ncbi:putative structural protein [Papaya meleira virus]|uniref:Putative structural protein n=1 Tax=Papaya meleira virus TaxID=1497848 RepID=A0A0P0QKV0_9VIRU|nr:putative structural protein [Papaya meleira virus]ALL54978.1 putative structural protein [Papaya meleira virus]
MTHLCRTLEPFIVAGHSGVQDYHLPCSKGVKIPSFYGQKMVQKKVATVVNHPLLPKEVPVPVGGLQKAFDKWDSIGVTFCGLQFYHSPLLTVGEKECNPYSWRGIKIINVPFKVKSIRKRLETRVRLSPSRRIISSLRFKRRINLMKKIKGLQGRNLSPKNILNFTKVFRTPPMIKGAREGHCFLEKIDDPLVTYRESCLTKVLNNILLKYNINGSFARKDLNSNFNSLVFIKDSQTYDNCYEFIVKLLAQEKDLFIYYFINLNNEGENHCSLIPFNNSKKIRFSKFITRFNSTNFFGDDEVIVYENVNNSIQDSQRRNKAIPEYNTILVPQLKELGNSQLIPSEYLLSNDYEGLEYSYDRYFGTIPQSFIFSPSDLKLDTDNKVITINRKTELFTEFPKEVCRLPETSYTNQEYILLSSINQAKANAYKVRRLASGLVTKDNIPVLPQYSSCLDIIKGRDISPNARKTIDEAFQVHRCYGTNVSRTGSSYETLRRSRFNQIYDLYNNVSSGQSYVRLYYRLFTRWAQAQVASVLNDRNTIYNPKGLKPGHINWQYSTNSISLRRDSVHYLASTGDGKYANILKGNHNFSSHHVSDGEYSLFGYAGDMFRKLQNGSAFLLDAEGLSHDVIREICTCAISIEEYNQPWLGITMDYNDTETLMTKFTIPGLYYQCEGVTDLIIHWGATEPEDVIPLRDLINVNFPDPGLGNPTGQSADNIPWPEFKNFSVATAPINLSTIEEAIRVMVARTHSAEEARLAFELVMSRMLMIDVTKTPAYNGNQSPPTSSEVIETHYPLTSKSNLEENVTYVELPRAHNSRFIQPTGANELKLPYVFSGLAYFDFMFHEMTIPSPLWEATVMKGNQFLNHAFVITHALSVSINWPSHTFSVDGGILDLAHNSDLTTPAMRDSPLAKRHINWLNKKSRLETPSIWSMCHKRATSVMYGFTLSDYFWLTGPRIPKDYYLTNSPIYLSHPYRLGWMIKKIPIHMVLPSSSLQPLWPKQEWTPKVYSNEIQSKVRVGRSFPVFQGFNWLQDGGMNFSLQYYLGIHNNNKYRYESSEWQDNTIQLASWDVPMQTEFPSAPKFINPVFSGPRNSQDILDNYMIPGFVRNYDSTTNRVKANGAKVYEEISDSQKFLIHLVWQRIIDGKQLTVPSISVIPPSGMPIQDLYDNEYAIISSFNHAVNEISFTMFMRGETLLTDAQRIGPDCIRDTTAVPASQFPAHLANHNEIQEPIIDRVGNQGPMDNRPGNTQDLNVVREGRLINKSAPITHQVIPVMNVASPLPGKLPYVSVAKKVSPEKREKKNKKVNLLKSQVLNSEGPRVINSHLANHNTIHEPLDDRINTTYRAPNVQMRNFSSLRNHRPLGIGRSTSPTKSITPHVDVNLKHTPISTNNLPKVNNKALVIKDSVEGTAIPKLVDNTNRDKVKVASEIKNDLFDFGGKGQSYNEKLYRLAKEMANKIKISDEERAQRTADIVEILTTNANHSGISKDTPASSSSSIPNEGTISGSVGQISVQPLPADDPKDLNLKVVNTANPVQVEQRPVELPVYDKPKDNLPISELSDKEAHISQEQLRALIKFKNQSEAPVSTILGKPEN